MGISRGEAYEMLELPIGADPDSIRTSYKRLALKFHPTRNTTSLEAATRFNEISLAYKRLMTDSEHVQISPDQSMELFQQMFAPKNTTYTNGYAVDSTDDDDDESDDDEEDDYNSYLDRLQMRTDGATGRSLTAEEIEKNANELITEEEKEKRRAEKRRAKKKRRREKKRIEKQKTEQKKDDEPKKKPGKVRENGDSSQRQRLKKGSSGSEAEDFDPNAAFFTQVVNKKKKTTGGASEAQPPTKPKHGETRLPSKDEDNADDYDPVVLRSRHLAIRGNEMANLGHYQVAIELFTEAVKLDPRDFRFFGNRSYCFDRMQQYERALKDADRAIVLAKNWPKGYFRKGRALAGMKLYADAEQSFMQVLKLDRNCEDAMQELLRVRTHQLTEMGFTKQQAEQAIRQHVTVNTAVETLLAGAVAENSLAGEVYVSDEEDYSTPSAQPTVAVPGSTAMLPPGGPLLTATATTTTQNTHPLLAQQQQQHHSKAADVKMDATNPEGLTALWVGNVLPEVKDKDLKKMFAEYGAVTSVRLLPEKYCAFINFKTKESAGRAMHGLQGMECAGQRLLIKFPDNPINNGSVVLRKGPGGLGGPGGPSHTKSSSTASSSATAPSSSTTTASSAAAINRRYQQPQQQQQQQQQQLTSSELDKLSGPVNGDECYFWRTTGCQFGKNCHYRHQPEHKGVDKKPWQKSTK